MTTKQEGEKIRQYLYAGIACIGALANGNILAWTSPSLPFLSSYNYSAPFILRSSNEGDTIAALMPFGALIGTLPAGIMADAFGRRLTMLIFSLPLLIAWTLTAFAVNVAMLYVARFIAGIVFGLFCGILPMYINELAEDSIRGTLGTFFQAFMTLGMLIVYTLGILNSYTVLSYCLMAISVALVFALLIIPETPTYLMKKNRVGEAEGTLRKIRGPHYDISIEMNAIKKGLRSPGQSTFSLSILCTHARIKSLIICVGLMFFQQFCGINSVIFFANSIFQNAGVSSPTMCTIIVGITQTLATLVSAALIDHAGRKILLFFSSLIAGVCLAALGYYFWLLEHKMDTSQVSWLPLCSLVLFIAGFSLGLGPIPWMMCVEVLDPEIKSFGATLSATTSQVGVTLVTYSFQQLQNMITTAGTFWFYAAMCVLSIAFILLVVPETKGKSTQEVQNTLAGKKLESKEKKSENLESNNPENKEPN